MQGSLSPLRSSLKSEQLGTPRGCARNFGSVTTGWSAGSHLHCRNRAIGFTADRPADILVRSDRLPTRRSRHGRGVRKKPAGFASCRAGWLESSDHQADSHVRFSSCVSTQLVHEHSIEEFDPGSARTLAAWLRHASRARKHLRVQVERRKGE